MSKISNKKKKFIKRNYKRLSIEELASQTGLKSHDVRSLIDDYDLQVAGEDQHRSTNLRTNIISRRFRYAPVMVVLFILTILLYTPALKNDFVTWDDNKYVYENVKIQSLNLQSLKWMLTSYHASNWHPLTWFSHALDYNWWGLNPAGHHLTSIVLHGLNTVLVFLLVMGLIMRAEKALEGAQALKVAGITALLFSFHPLRVESVAWISERKDVLCAFFFLATLVCYMAYTSSSTKKFQWRWFISCLFLFLFALMSKPMAVTLPVILLLVDYYPLMRLKFPFSANLPPLLEKIPFFVLGIASCAITFKAQQSGGAIVSLENIPMDLRLLNALHALLFYIKQLFWPLNLVPVYPFSKHILLTSPRYFIAATVVLAFTINCLWMVKRRHYLLFTVWSYYVITLLPVLGIIQVGNQRAADRYTYLPSISICLLVGLGIVWAWRRTSRSNIRAFRNILPSCLVALLLVLSYLTIQQINIWKKSEIFWSYTIKAFPETFPKAYVQLGVFYVQEGRLDEAIQQYKKALSINPRYDEAHNNLGFVYINKGMFDEAIEELETTLTINPNLMEAHINLGLVYSKKGMPSEAIEEYKKALKINPDYAKAHNNLSVRYYYMGNYKLAIIHCDKAIELGLNVHPGFLKLLNPHR
jgi:tetratricopeptide (TPR) repeat protein